MAKWDRIKLRLDEIEHLVRTEGYTLDMVAKYLGIGRTTLYKWKQDGIDYDTGKAPGVDPLKRDFSNILAHGRWHQVKKLQDSAYKVAHGYSYTETHLETEWVGDPPKKGEKKKAKNTKVKKVTKEVQPDGTMVKWLLSVLNPAYRIDKRDDTAGDQNQLSEVYLGLFKVALQKRDFQEAREILMDLARISKGIDLSGYIKALNEAQDNGKSRIKMIGNTLNKKLNDIAQRKQDAKEKRERRAALRRKQKQDRGDDA